MSQSVQTATFVNAHGDRQSFDLKYCPVYIFWRGRLWRLQPGDDWIYKETTVATLEQLTAA